VTPAVKNEPAKHGKKRKAIVKEEDEEELDLGIEPDEKMVKLSTGAVGEQAVEKDGDDVEMAENEGEGDNDGEAKEEKA